MSEVTSGIDTAWIVAIVSAVSGLAGVLGTKVVDWIGARGKVKADENTQRFEQLSRDRADLNAAFAAMRQDLMSQILDLRSQVLKLQEQNTTYAIENTELKATVREWEAKVRELESEVAELKVELQHERARADARDAKDGG